MSLELKTTIALGDKDAVNLALFLQNNSEGKASYLIWDSIDYLVH
jgi:hypothetical protein